MKRLQIIVNPECVRGVYRLFKKNVKHLRHLRSLGLGLA